MAAKRGSKVRSVRLLTGTPAFLPDMLLERRVDPAALNDLVVGDADLAAFNIRQPRTEALLFQTGYLTILGEEPGAAGVLYRLGYPNREVRSALAWLMAMAPMPAVPWRRSRREATRRSTDTLACPSTKWA